MKKTIGFYDDSERRGGTTRYLSNLLAGINREEFELVFFAPYARAWHKDLTDAGVEIQTLYPEPVAAVTTAPAAASSTLPRPTVAPLLRWIVGTLREILNLQKLFRRRQVDVLHSNNAGAEAAPIAARLAGMPRVIATWHVDSTYDLDGVRNGPQYRLLEKSCMRSLHHAISVSRATAVDWIRRCELGESYWKKVTVIYNGVPTGELHRQRSVEEAKRLAGLADRLVVGSTGRLERAKGYEYLIRALPEIVRDQPNVLVRIAGRGELHDQLQEIARSLDVEQHIDFAGFVHDVQGFLESIDVYVQPSLCEALPFAVLEAGAVGVPIVASDVGGVAECVRDGEMGFVVPPRDSKALGEAILRLTSNGELRVRMSSEVERVVSDNFDVSKMVEQTVELYRELLRS
jgi:glycosyltransferase involved in cell wall biosynthesis